MIERADAIKAVEEQLARDFPRGETAGAAPPRMVVVDVTEHELVWIVSWDSEEYVRTGNPGARLAGNGPYLVDRLDGGLHSIGPVSAVTGEWEDDYRARIRGLPVRTAVEDLHDEAREVAAVHGRVTAARTLRRRLPTLSPRDCLEYVDALLTGAPPPHPASVAAKALAPPLNPVLAVKTVRPSDAPPLSVPLARVTDTRPTSS
ncbi:YrhB domain-containing protein [Streptomyces sp. NPDC003717]|uniref:YrhB domain-containing protein n=1 Tax=Streptomyces sp. NPDC003717 TaxID=3154276 RepID=UPI0033A9C813